MPLQVEIRVRRGTIEESRHHIDAALCDVHAARVAEAGDAGLRTSFRSAAKPFQLLPLVERGHADRWGFREEELAVMAASHTGSDYHLALVRGILDRIGLEPRHLACGYHDPSDPASLQRLRAHPAERSPLYNNCSGKHAGMLCLALSEGWPVEGYEQASHPLQQLMRESVAACCGVAPESLDTGIDGCSVVVFGLPLSAMAAGYARLARAREGTDPRSRALARIAAAMTAYPVATDGEGRFSTALMQSAPGALLAKGGAEGLQLVALMDRGLGLAVKCDDGAARAVPPATMALLEHLDLLPEGSGARLESWRRPVVQNVVGRNVGSLEAVVRVPAPGAA